MSCAASSAFVQRSGWLTRAIERGSLFSGVEQAESHLKRIIVIAVAAVAALGVGVTVGSSHQEHGSALTAAPHGGQTPDQLCEQAAQQLRAKHPDAYVSACNHGASTLSV